MRRLSSRRGDQTHPKFHPHRRCLSPVHASDMAAPLPTLSEASQSQYGLWSPTGHLSHQRSPVPIYEDGHVVPLMFTSFGRGPHLPSSAGWFGSFTYRAGAISEGCLQGICGRELTWGFPGDVTGYGQTQLCDLDLTVPMWV